MIFKTFLFYWILSGTSFAQNSSLNSATELAPVRVFGLDRETLSQSIAPGRVGKEKIRDQQITDVNRALKQTAGVYVREEDGQGLRPNIGLRGTDPDRSKKVVLMEDGVLIGPAPYSAPAAYYTPNMNHVESLDIYKGFMATGIGPNSVGGAIDYRTLTIPSKIDHGLKASYGSFNTWDNEVLTGGPTEFGGYLVQGSHWTSDGFKKLDGGGNTGFIKKDILGKLRFDLPSDNDRMHAIEFKFGYGDEDSHETYLGLTRADFDNKFDRRYVASQLDEMKWAHRQFQLRHEWQPTSDTLVATSVYHHEFHRIWYRLDRFRNTAVNLTDILKNPDSVTNSAYYQILKGDLDSSTLGGTDGQLIMASNDRNYVSQGVQAKWSSLKGPEDEGFKPWFFLRLHSDRIDRNHGADDYEMISREMTRTIDPRVIDLMNREATLATTASTGADWNLNHWVVTPVVRFESANFEKIDKLNNANNKDRSDSAWVGGLSVLKKIGERFSIRASGNNATTLAGLDIAGGEVREEAFNSEIEIRFIDPANWMDFQLTAFHTDYKNLIGTCTVSSGCTVNQLDTVINGGKAKVMGIESGFSKGFELGAFFFPIQGNVTLLQAEFDSDFASTSSLWGVGTVRKGDPLPYIPQTQYSLSLGLEWKKFKQDFVFTYQSKVFDQSAQTNRQEIEAHGVVDWSGQYKFTKSAVVLAKIDNILGREYAAGARPFGLRPGKPQSFQIGVGYDF